jgi:hypothetical protein
MKTERGDLMREALKKVHEFFRSEPYRDGPFYVVPVPYTDNAFIVINYGPNRGGTMSKFMALKSGWYTMPEEWFLEVLR